MLLGLVYIGYWFFTHPRDHAVLYVAWSYLSMLALIFVAWVWDKAQEETRVQNRQLSAAVQAKEIAPYVTPQDDRPSRDPLPHGAC